LNECRVGEESEVAWGEVRKLISKKASKYVFLSISSLHSDIRSYRDRVQTLIKVAGTGGLDTEDLGKVDAPGWFNAPIMTFAGM
jgi:hypothetical protein